MMTAVIEVTGLTKRYGGKSVVDDISFHVDQGEIFGILGPNGAGKTTAVECMEGCGGGTTARCGSSAWTR
jgi:ABC-2 type transport system ATP-binding protein